MLENEPLRELKREVKVEFKPERSDPYGLDYKIMLIREGATQSIPISFNELMQIQQQIEDMHKC